MEFEKYLEVLRNVDKMANYLKDSGFDFVITAKPINQSKNQHEFIVSCTKQKRELQE